MYGKGGTCDNEGGNNSDYNVVVADDGGDDDDDSDDDGGGDDDDDVDDATNNADYDNFGEYDGYDNNSHDLVTNDTDLELRTIQVNGGRRRRQNITQLSCTAVPDLTN